MAGKQEKNWAMVIDQERCIGCWTCAVGCKEINNEPLGFWWNRILTAAPGERQWTLRCAR